MRRPRILPATLLAIALAACLASCGGGDSKPAASGPASLIPAETPIYLEATLRPGGEQKANAEALLSELGSVPLLGSQISPDQLADQAVQAFDSAVGADVDYAADVEPWLGAKVGFGISDFSQAPTGLDGAATADKVSYVLAIETTDDAIARDALTRILSGDGSSEEEYDGVHYFQSANGLYDTGVFDGMLVFATVDQFEAAVDAAHGGDSLGASDDFEQAFAPLDEEGLGSLYVDFDKVAELATSAGTADSTEIEEARKIFPELFDAPLAAELVAGESSLALDLSLVQPDQNPLDIAATDRLGDAPPDSYAALGLADTGGLFKALAARLEAAGDAVDDSTLHSGTIEDALQQQFGFGTDDLAGALGDGIAWASGEIGTSGGAQVDVDDDSASGVPAKLLDGLEQEAKSSPDTTVGPPRGPDPVAGFGTQDDSVTTDFELGAGELTTLLASDPSLLVAPGNDKLADVDGFTSATDALGTDYPAIGYIDLEPILEQAVGSFSIPDAIIGGTPPEQAIVQFIASKLHSAALGAREAGGRLVLRAAVTVGG